MTVLPIKLAMSKTKLPKIVLIINVWTVGRFKYWSIFDFDKIFCPLSRIYGSTSNQILNHMNSVYHETVSMKKMTRIEWKVLDYLKYSGVHLMG